MDSVGFKVGTVDRQLFFKKYSTGKVLIATTVHVDDLLSLILHGIAQREFHYQWTARFGGKPLGAVISYMATSRVSSHCPLLDVEIVNRKRCT